jgi:formylglycine-generating enzyme required for sulfatase activity
MKSCVERGFNAQGILPGVLQLRRRAPALYLTWFQAQQACMSVGKRLPTNAEWQAAAAGTPDTGDADDHATTCNTDGLPRTLRSLVPAQTVSPTLAFSTWWVIGKRR